MFVLMLCDSGCTVWCVAGASLKVCPQGFSCCTAEMEEKLSQQSHTEIKAPVSRLSTNLQSTFKQRHEHFDSKQTLLHKLTHTVTPAAPQTASGCCPTVAVLESRQRVCVQWPVHLPHSVFTHPPFSFLSLQRRVMPPDGPHARSDFVFSVLPVPLCVSTCVCVCVPVNIGIGFLLLSTGTHGNMQQCWLTEEAWPHCHRSAVDKPDIPEETRRLPGGLTGEDGEHFIFSLLEFSLLIEVGCIHVPVRLQVRAPRTFMRLWKAARHAR